MYTPQDFFPIFGINWQPILHSHNNVITYFCTTSVPHLYHITTSIEDYDALPQITSKAVDGYILCEDIIVMPPLLYITRP